MPAEKATEKAERLIIQGILDGTYPPGSELPGERDLSKEAGVARPALRVALARLSHDGWVSIQQGKPTRVNDFMQDGNLNILINLLQVNPRMLPDLIPNLLELWGLLLPIYTRRALENDPQAIADLLFGYRGLDDRSEPYTRAMWRMHRLLLKLNGNPLYGMIFNSFERFYERLATQAFHVERTRKQARALWEAMYQAIKLDNIDDAIYVAEAYFDDLYRHWQTDIVLDLIEAAWANNDGDRDNDDTSSTDASEDLPEEA